MKTERLSLALVIIVLLILIVLGTCCAHIHVFTSSSGEYRAYLYFKEAYFATENSGLLGGEGDWNRIWRSENEANDFMAFLKKKLSFMNLVEPTFKDFRFFNNYGELLSFYWEWSKINPHHLTSDQKDFLEHFRQWEKVRTVEEEKDDRELISVFPWINPDKMTTRDKIFIDQVAEGIAIGLMH